MGSAEMIPAFQSFLGLEGLHVLVTGSAGGIGTEIVNELLGQGCNVTAVDRLPAKVAEHPPPERYEAQLQILQADISSEESISSAIEAASKRFGPINILVANAGVSDELHNIPIWEMPVEHWDRINNVNYRGTFLTIKHFLAAANRAQVAAEGVQMKNLAIVITGSECGKFGQEGHVDYATGKAGLQYGLVRTVKNEIIRMNSLARINAVAPGWVNTPLINGRLDDEFEAWAEAHSTVALKKVAEPYDVARAVLFLASHRAAGHISGEVLSVDGGMEGRLLFKYP
ncbi:hypothetical protein PV11_00360 [Exophiala sideris]|uniref:Uncharacterized protein n=1 Tax=Exophiala sideris TaxID=1016849 RepID=A0A0D1YP35_9EURO|nr:hypothetical protein PV11_00360 [Exophiala sideris]